MKKAKFRKVIGRMAASIAATAMMMPPALADAAQITYEEKGPGETAVPVIATYEGARPGALIPTSIEFEGDTGHYTIYAYVDRASVADVETILNIVPQSSFTLTKDGSSDSLSAAVVQDRTAFGKAELEAGSDGELTAPDGSRLIVKQAPGNGTISIANMTKGTWRGTLVFSVSTEEVPKEPTEEPIGCKVCDCGWRVDVYAGRELEAEDALFAHQDETGCTGWGDYEY